MKLKQIKKICPVCGRLVRNGYSKKCNTCGCFLEKIEGYRQDYNPIKKVYRLKYCVKHRQNEQ